MNVLDAFVADLREIFGERLHATVAYDVITSAAESARADSLIHTLSLVDRMTFEDVAACAVRHAGWERQGLGTPVVMGRSEFARSLDAFPLEYGQIIATHRVLAGSDPFEGLAVKPEDMRRACEVQAKSHLIHLREAYIEAGGRPAMVARLIVASVAPFRSLLASVVRLQGNSDGGTATIVREAEAMGLQRSVVEQILSLKGPRDVARGDGQRLFPNYLSAVERLARHIDEWKR